MDFLTRDSKYIWHPFTGSPPVGPRELIVKGEREWLIDSNGRRYFDATSSWWCQIHGHSHPELVRALSRQAETLDHALFAPHSHAPAILLAELLLKELGEPFKKVFYSDNGSTAVETAMKMCWQFWRNKKVFGRIRFAAFEGAYHGDTLGAVSLGGVDKFHGHFKDFGAATVSVPVPSDRDSLETGKEMLRAHADTLCAFFVEPLIQGARGMKFHTAPLLNELVSFAKKSGVLVVFDEVFTAFGRTGSFFAFQQIEERPDIICLAKGLTSGMLPLSATVVRDEIFESFASDTFFHGHTFSGNPLGCAVGLRSLELFRDERVLEKNKELESILKEACESIEGSRHLGMVFAFEVAGRSGWDICERVWEKGIWMRPLGNTLYVIPPYCTSPSTLKSVLNILAEEVKRAL